MAEFAVAVYIMSATALVLRLVRATSITLGNALANVIKPGEPWVLRNRFPNGDE